MNWADLGAGILAGNPLGRQEALEVVRSPDSELLSILEAAFTIRLRYFGMGVTLHVIRNAKSGACSEDCSYCSQSAKSTADIPRYSLQSVDKIVEGSREAARLGAMRYCIVISGRQPADSELELICEAARRIKREMNIQICTSLGLLDDLQAGQLKAAGVDRYNHNLETSSRHYGAICSTHSYADRVNTARTVKRNGLELCCGGLVGTGESLEDRVDLALALRDVEADSIPLNFLDPRPGTALEGRPRISAADVLRSLALFRFANPAREIRVAGGREACLGPLQVLALYPANSIFTTGYLTTGGQGHSADMTMIHGAGFHVAGITDA
ncbi:MAG: biotin synthase BioB [bacterium]